MFSILQLKNSMIVFALSLIIAVFAPTIFANAQEKPLKQKLCDVYANVYEGANKAMASVDAGGFGDNSAPRETNRQLKLLNERLQQIIVIQQMQAHGCRVPKMLSSGSGYTLQAMKCSTEMLKGNFKSPECDQSKWKSFWKDQKHFQ